MSDSSPIDNLLGIFQNQLERDWRTFRDIEGNDTARGASYEDALSDILSEYFGGIYNVETNCSVMDANLECFNEFDSSSQNEFDVVSLFRQANPRVILREGDITWVPLSAIAFLCEAKSKVDTGRLEDDLEKLESLRLLEADPDDRFPTKVSGDVTVDHQVHCLVYDRAEISNSAMTDLLDTYSTAWDIVLIVETDTVIVNGTIPYIEFLRDEAAATQLDAISDDSEGGMARAIDDPTHDFISVSNGFAWFMIVIGLSIPIPLSVQTVELFRNIVKETPSGAQYGAKTSVTSDDTLLSPLEPEDVEEVDPDDNLTDTD